MENQHRKISGYRELSQEEIDLINKIKQLGPVIESVLIELQGHIQNKRKNGELEQHTPSTISAMDNATPERFLALAKTELQTGLMYATRAVAQPEFF